MDFLCIALDYGYFLLLKLLLLLFHPMNYVYERLMWQKCVTQYWSISWRFKSINVFITKNGITADC